MKEVRERIDSAVSDKIGFLGMELQAVPPSVLHPPMSEKAIRARKKYTRQEEVRAIELRNSSKLVGLNLNFKLRSHKYFQKLGRRRVQDFFESSEDRAEWHRVRSAGDFLYRS